MPLADNLREFVELLNSHKVEYLIVGAHALAFHGHPRYTGDLDILVHNSAENAERVRQVVMEFGFQSADLTATDFQQSGQIIQLDRPPQRIDILTSLSGVEFSEAWESRIQATDRLQDRADVEALEPKG